MAMAEYIHVLWRHTRPDDPVEMLYEVQSDRSVSRTVNVFPDGRSEANTLDWEKSLHPTFVGRSLVDDDMPTAKQIREQVARKSPGEFTVHEATEQQFEAAFRAGEPLRDVKGEKQ